MHRKTHCETVRLWTSHTSFQIVLGSTPPHTRKASRDTPLHPPSPWRGPCNCVTVAPPNSSQTTASMRVAHHKCSTWSVCDAQPLALTPREAPLPEQPAYAHAKRPIPHHLRRNSAIGSRHTRMAAEFPWPCIASLIFLFITKIFCYRLSRRTSSLSSERSLRNPIHSSPMDLAPPA
jgi:hypothetical protein